jgi:hypothetical protein
MIKVEYILCTEHARERLATRDGWRKMSFHPINQEMPSNLHWVPPRCHHAGHLLSYAPRPMAMYRVVVIWKGDP